MTPVRAEEKVEDLEKRIQELEVEIQANEKQVQSKQKEARSLQRDIDVLAGEIKDVGLKIKQTDLLIKKTSQSISHKGQEIQLLENKILDTRDIIAEHLRTLNYYDDQSLLEIFLRQKRLSEVFDTAAGLEAIQNRLHDNLGKLRASKEVTHKQKQELEGQYDEQNDLQRLQYNQKTTVQSKKNTKNTLLKKTKKEEAVYNKEIREDKNEIANIRAKIRLLQSGGRELSFEEAVDLAEYASSLTGVRTAFILSILWQESEFGSNLGSCNYKTALRNRSSSWITNQTNAFLQITEELGKDPEKTLVSCPIKSNGKYVGSGGAMGPAQFMPSTWLAYRNDVKELIGHMPDPWAIEDAIVSMAHYLKINGGKNDERRAAGAYFGKCKFSWVDYCNSVIKRANAYQKEIDKN